MHTKVNAIYEHGALRLLGPIDLREGETVTVSIRTNPSPLSAESANAILDRISALAIRREGDNFSGSDHDSVLYGEE